MSNWNLTYLEEGKLRWLDAKGRCMIISESGIVNTATGDPAEFSDGSENYVKSCICDIVPAQDLHGYDAPWPAGGGKNLLNSVDTEIGKAWNGAANTARARLIIPCEASTTYTLSMNGTNGMDSIYLQYSDVIPALSAGSDIESFPYTVTTAEDSAYIIIGFNKTDIAQTDVDALKLQLEKGSTATAWSPYSNICPISGYTSVTLNVADDDTTPTVSTDYTTALPQTVYGGSLDMVSGVLTIDRALVDLGALNWEYFAGSPYKFRSSNDIGALPPASAGSTPDAISSMYPVLPYSVANTTEKSMTIVFSTSGFAGQVWVNDSSYNSAASFKAAMSGVQLVYKLETQQTIQLNPTEILSLYGDNVFSSIDKVTVIYLADTKKYIDNAVNP